MKEEEWKSFLKGGTEGSKKEMKEPGLLEGDEISSYNRKGQIVGVRVVEGLWAAWPKERRGTVTDTENMSSVILNQFV